jgi:hypothetical protein
MIPPHFVPPGVLQLYEITGNTKTLIQELPSSSKNRMRLNQMRHDLLMVNPTRNLVLSENNVLR